MSTSDTVFTRGESPLRAEKLNAAFEERVSRSGDTMTGPLNLLHNPVAPTEAVTKAYVDGIALGTITPVVTSFNTRTGPVVLNSSDITSAGGALLAGPQTHTGVHSIAAQPYVRSDVAGGQLQSGYSGVDGYANNWLWGNTRWYGNITGADPSAGGQVGANKLMFFDAGSITGDNASALFMMSVVTGNTSAANTAARNASHSRIVAAGQIGPTPPSIGPLMTNAFFVAQQSIGYANATQGGLGGWSAGLNPSVGYFRGSLFGGNDNVWLTTGVTNYFMLVGREIDVSIQGTATCFQRFGFLESSFQSTRQAAGDDAGLAFVNAVNNGFNHKNSIQFGATTAPHEVSDSLIKVVARVYPSPATPAYVTGIDFTQGTFSGNAIATPGFAVSGAGNAAAKAVRSDPAGISSQIGVSGTDAYTWNWLYGRTRWFGTLTGSDPTADGSVGVNKLLFTDAAVIPSGINGINAGAFYVQTVIEGNTSAGNTAARNATHAHIAVTGQVGPTPTLGPLISSPIFVVDQITGYAVATQGGLGGWLPANNPSVGYFRGQLFGGNDNVWLTTGASNYWQLIGREIDVMIDGSASVYARIGLLVVTPTSTRQAAGDDAGLVFASASAAGFNHKNAIQFGTTTATIDVTDALIKVVAAKYPSPLTPSFPAGIDFTQGTFSGNAIATPGFSVDGDGDVTAKSLTLAQALRVNGNVGFNNTAPIAKPTVTGSKGANAALASLLTALASYGLITDSST